MHDEKINYARKQFREWLTFLNVNKKYSVLLVAFFMTLALNTTMTFTMTTINTGWSAGFFQRFLNGGVLGFIVAFPTSILVIPLARSLVSKSAEL